MDKLKEIQKYQFWIFLAVALILPFVGWIMGTSGMVAEAVARTTLLKELDGKLKVTPDDPNGDWERRLAEINAEQEKQKLLAWRDLYGRQKPKMIWLKEMKISDPEEIQPLQMEIYRVKYRDLLEKIRQIVKPIADDDPQTGLVTYPEELLPNPDAEWVNQAPSRKQIEDSQEDLWLLEAVLKCIASVNQGAPSAYEAPIREITELFFRGGSPKGSGGLSSAKSAGSSGSMPTGGAMPTGGHGGGAMGMMPSMARLGGLSTFDGGGGGAIADPKINADEELGPERPAADAKTDTKVSTSSATSSSMPTGGHSGSTMMPPGSSGMPMGMKLGGLMGGGGSNMERYRDDQTEWKTRGFTLQVVMDHRRIPDLLVALSNCEWPINILRVHEADYKDEDLVSADSNGAGSPMAMPGRSAGSYGGARGPAGGHAGSSAAGMGGMPGMPRGGMPAAPKASAPRGLDESGEGSFNTRSALDDPNLANVSIVGVIYIFKKPPPETAVVAAPQQTPGGAPGQPAQGTVVPPAPETDPAHDGPDDSEPAKTEDGKPDEPNDKPGDSSDDSGDSSGSG